MPQSAHTIVPEVPSHSGVSESPSPSEVTDSHSTSDITDDNEAHVNNVRHRTEANPVFTERFILQEFNKFKRQLFMLK